MLKLRITIFVRRKLKLCVDRWERLLRFTLDSQPVLWVDLLESV